MVYNRTGRGRYNNKNKKKYQTKGLTKKQVASVKTIAKEVAQVEAELKSYHKLLASQATPVNVDNLNPYITELTSIPQDTVQSTDSVRIGDEVNLRGISVRMYLNNQLGINNDQDTLWRVIIFQYKSQDNNPSPLELLTASTANGTSALAGPFSYRNIDYLSIYHVLYDRQHRTVGSNGQAAIAYDYYHQRKYVEINIKMTKYIKQKIRFENGTVASTNGIWMFVLNDNEPATVRAQIVGTSRILFTDA